MKLVTARKEHRCDTCGRLIAVGVKYWQQHEDQGDAVNSKEHTNCLDFEKAEELPVGFNQNRNKRK